MSGQPQGVPGQFEEIRPRDEAGAHELQVGRGDLAVDEGEAEARQQAHKVDECHLGGVGAECEHGLAEEHPAQRHPVQPAHQPAIEPGLDRVGVAEPMEAVIGFDHLRHQPGPFLAGTRRYGTVLDEDSQIPATATGSISQDDINLDVKLTEQKENYRLSLTLVGSQLEGSYQLYDMQKLSESGNATATRSGS